MAKNNHIVIKTSPMTFVKRLAVLELLTASVTFFLRYIPQITNVPYAQIPLINTIPISLLSITVVAVAQVVLIMLIFFTWYTERYTVTKKTINFSRGDIFKKTLVTNLKTVTSVQVEQSWLASMTNYGTILIITQEHEQIHLNNIPNPREVISNLRSHLRQIRGNHGTVKNLPLGTILKSGEGQHVEYKSSLQWDFIQEKRNSKLHKAIMKNIAAFINSSGGTILVGINDKSKVVGLEKDYTTLSKKNSDGWENTFTMAFKKHIGVEHMRYVEVLFEDQKDHQIAKIICQPGTQPVYLKNEDLEEFYIRTGNSSQPLSVSQAVSYILDHFTSD